MSNTGTGIGSINYATSYSKSISQAYAGSLNFGALYATPNNGRYKMGDDGKSIKIPSIKTTGRIDADRDALGFAKRNFDNAWETKTLTNQRTWGTLVHPKDIDQSNMVNTIANITRVFNEEQKFPEMDAYCLSTLYSLFVGQGGEADEVVLTAENILDYFDKMMLAMDNGLVPPNGRILYCTYEVRTMLKNATDFVRNFALQSGGTTVDRRVNRLDEVEIVGVPKTLMKTLYDFSEGWKAEDGAQQVEMFLVHPTAVITPVSYDFVSLDAPNAMTQGKWVYFEESFEDVFILNNKLPALQFVVAPEGTSGS